MSDELFMVVAAVVGGILGSFIMHVLLNYKHIHQNDDWPGMGL